EFLDREHEAARRSGLAAEIVQETALPFPISAALRLADQAQFHPLLYARGLARALADNCAVYENSQATEIDGTRGVVTTEKGKVRAKQIIIATHTPKGFFPVQLLLSPIREFGLAAEL